MEIVRRNFYHLLQESAGLSIATYEESPAMAVDVIDEVGTTERRIP